jgi:hypothetical protein
MLMICEKILYGKHVISKKIRKWFCLYEWTFYLKTQEEINRETFSLRHLSEFNSFETQAFY